MENFDHITAAVIYETSDARTKKYYGVLGVIFLHYQMPEIVKLIRGLINEKNN